MEKEKISNLIKKDEILMFNELLKKAYIGRNICFPKNPKRIFTKDEFHGILEKESIETSIFHLYFTEERESINLNEKVLDRLDRNKPIDVLRFWLYYKIFGKTDILKKACVKDTFFSIFLLKNVFEIYSNITNEEKEKTHNLEIKNHGDCFVIYFNGKEKNLLDVLEEKLTHEDKEILLEFLDFISKDIFDCVFKD